MQFDGIQDIGGPRAGLLPDNERTGAALLKEASGISQSASEEGMSCTSSRTDSTSAAGGRASLDTTDFPADERARQMIEMCSAGSFLHSALSGGREISALIDLYIGEDDLQDYPELLSADVQAQLVRFEANPESAFVSPSHAPSLLRCMHLSARSFYRLPSMLDSLFDEILKGFPPKKRKKSRGTVRLTHTGHMERSLARRLPGVVGEHEGSAPETDAGKRRPLMRRRQRDRVSITSLPFYFVHLHVSIREINSLLTSTLQDPFFLHIFGPSHGVLKGFLDQWDEFTDLVRNGDWTALSDTLENLDGGRTGNQFRRSVIMKEVILLVAECARHQSTVQLRLSWIQRLASMLIHVPAAGVGGEAAASVKNPLVSQGQQGDDAGSDSPDDPADVENPLGKGGNQDNNDTTHNPSRYAKDAVGPDADSQTSTEALVCLTILLFAAASLVVCLQVVIIVAMNATGQHGSPTSQSISDMGTGPMVGIIVPAVVVVLVSLALMWSLYSSRTANVITSGEDHQSGWYQHAKMQDLRIGLVSIYAASVTPLLFVEAELFTTLQRPWGLMSTGWFTLFIPSWCSALLALLAARQAPVYAEMMPVIHAHIARSSVMYGVGHIVKTCYTTARRLPSDIAVPALEMPFNITDDGTAVDTVSVTASEIVVFALANTNAMFLVLLFVLGMVLMMNVMQPLVARSLHHRRDAELYRFLLTWDVPVAHAHLRPARDDAARRSDSVHCPIPIAGDDQPLLEARNTKLYEYSEGAVDVRMGFAVTDRASRKRINKAEGPPQKQIIEGIDNSMLYTLVGVFVCDTDWEIVHWNYRMWHLTGRLPDETLGLTLSAVMKPASHGELLQKCRETHDIAVPALTSLPVSFTCSGNDVVLNVFVTPGIPTGTDNFLRSPDTVMATHYVFYCTQEQAPRADKRGKAMNSENKGTISPPSLSIACFATNIFFCWVTNELSALVTRGSTMVPQETLSGSQRQAHPGEPASKRIIGRLQRLSMRSAEHARTAPQDYTFTNLRGLLTKAVSDNKVALPANLISFDHSVPESILTCPRMLTSLFMSLVSNMLHHNDPPPGGRRLDHKVMVTVKISSCNVGAWRLTETNARQEDDSDDPGSALDMLLGATLVEETMESKVPEARCVLMSVFSSVPLVSPQKLESILDEPPGMEMSNLKEGLPDINFQANHLGGYLTVESVNSGEYKGGTVVHVKIPCFDAQFVQASLAASADTAVEVVDQQAKRRHLPIEAAVNGPTAPPRQHGNAERLLNPSVIKCLIIDDDESNRLFLAQLLWERGYSVLVRTSLEDVGANDYAVLIFNVTESDVHLEDLFEKFKSSTSQVILASTLFDDGDIKQLDQTEDWWYLSLPYNQDEVLGLLDDVGQRLIRMEKIQTEIADIRKAFAGNASCPWERGQCVGVGSFGKVYEATNKLTGGKMACKIVPLSQCDNHEAIFREVTVMASLSHPNIIHYFYCERDEDELRIFMELADGCLSQKVPANGVSVTVASLFMKDIIMGLRYIHSKNLVHRDMKVANVLMHRGTCKLIDFGTVIETKSKQKESSTIMNTSISGTPHYMSPEVLDGKAYDWRADIWALGCMLMEMLTGKPPWAHAGSGSWAAVKYVCQAAKTPDKPLDYGPHEYHEHALAFFNVTLSLNPKNRQHTSTLLDSPLITQMNEEVVRKASVIYASMKRKESLASFHKGKTAAKGTRVKASKADGNHDARQDDPRQDESDDEGDRRGTTFSGWGG